MRRKKNITLNLQNITSHFTGKEKIITLVFIIIMLSFVNIISTSALSYQSSVGVGFTFNPTLSVSISPSDLIIPSLTPGTTADSNNITVSVATNAAYGYALSAIVNGNNSDLTHTDNSINNGNNNGNSNNVFSSIATDSSLPNLVTDNTWGYSYKLSNDTNWNNYSGLSNETSKTLVDSNDQTAIPIDFKIGAKAASTQASGTYTGVINFTAVTKPTPMNLAESYFAAGKTRHNGYYAMQDMTSEICNNTEVIGEGSQTELIDLRDSKVYWATKLADGHCWMTQNLDLDLDSNRTYTHWDTDLGWNNPNNLNTNATWRPIRSTINFDGTNTTQVPGWATSYTEPYSANPGDIYFYTSNSDANDIQYNSLQDCINAEHNNCTHYHAGNYYNWSAAVASNDTSSLAARYDTAPGSICPSGWRLPIVSNGDTVDYEFGNLLYLQNVTKKINSNDYVSDGFNKIRKSPLYFVNSGSIWSSLVDAGRESRFWYSVAEDEKTDAYALYLYNRNNQRYAFYSYGSYRHVGYSVRCLAR